MARTSRTDFNEKSPTKGFWKTAFYIRLSREDGNDESYSVKNQKQRLNAYFGSLTSHEQMVLVDTFVDDGFTGTDSNRDDFQRLLLDIDTGKINCVIVKDLSRLSRNDWECKRYLQHLFVLKDVRFISLELPALDSFKRPDDVYELGVSIQSMYNENHCRETSIKVRGTFNTKREKGEFIGAFAPYGYKKNPNDKHKLVIDKNVSPIVKNIFHWFVCDGMSKNGIVKKLIELGIPCPSEYKRASGLNYQNPNIGQNPQWSARSITTILSNKMYLGHMVQGKQRIKSYKIHLRITVSEDEWFIKENTHEAIIDEPTFKKAQELMKKDTRTPPKSEKLYKFSGFLKCADCKKAVCRRTAKNIVYYACQTYTTKGLCTRHSIRNDKLEIMVLSAIKTQIELIDDFSIVIDDIKNSNNDKSPSDFLENSIKLQKKSLDKFSNLRKGLYIDWKNGDITHAEYHSMKDDFKKHEEKLEKDIKSLQSESKLSVQDSKNAPLLDDFIKNNTITTLDRGIIAELIKTILIHENGNITIQFNFAKQWEF